MIVRLFEHFEWFYTTKVVNNNDIRNTSKNFFRAILPDFMNLHQIIINKSSAQTFRSGLLFSIVEIILQNFFLQTQKSYLSLQSEKSTKYLIH